MAKIINMTAANISSCKRKNTLYLNQFIFSDTPIDPNEYATNLMAEEKLLSYIDELRIIRKKRINEIS